MGSHSLRSVHGSAADGVGDDAFFRAHGFLRRPRLVQWLVTGRCPLHCAHCLAAPLAGAGPSLAQAARILDQLAGLEVDELLITGGEPLAREDFHLLVKLIAERELPWSLNTAIWPGRRARRAMAAHPPRFVAVSLDGPGPIHDRLRGRIGACDEAMAALAWYAELGGCAVAAGTTVSALNFDSLADTFPLVLGSGAGSWGLHLLVPEGRAADRRDLDLTPGQERWLLRFVADKRSHFPVQLADEMGFCGPWEPLVRDAPFFCGAGRAGCVILPDGEVVPCTTADGSTSAGNVHRQSLATIWRSGFRSLRQRVPTGKCRTCQDADLCGGGCWLRRRRDQACSRPVWQVSRAASVACLSALLGLGAATAQADPPHVPAPVSGSEQAAREMQILQRSIVQWYAAELGGRRAPDVEATLAALRQALPGDPGARYFLDFAAGKRARRLRQLAEGIEAALGTRQRSLCLIALFFRDLLEWSLAAPEPGRRAPAERALLRRLLTLLGQTAEAWRSQVFAERLDPFLRRPEQYRRFLISKAGPTALQRVQGKLARTRGFSQPDLGAAFLKVHTHAESMSLAFEAVASSGLRIARRGSEAPSDGRMGLFDLLLTPLRPLTIHLSLGRQKLVVLLPPAAELSYGDLLGLAYGQHQELFDRLAAAGHGPPPREPLLLPALLARLGHLSAGQESERLRLRWVLTDLFLF